MTIYNGGWFENRREIASKINRIGVDGGFLGDSFVIAGYDGSDLEKGGFLSEAYSVASSLTPNGEPLSATNRAVVILPPGVYDMGDETFNVDTNFVDIHAMSPETPQLPADEQKPTSTVIKSTADYVFTQTATDTRWVGFTLRNEARKGTFYIAQNGCDDCYYEKMYFSTDADLAEIGFFPQHFENVEGTWRDCICAHAWAWRIAIDTTTSFFTAKMYNCHAQYWSFGGDYVGGQADNHKFIGAYLEGCTAGDYSFSGCTAFSAPIDEDTVFVDCEAGINSFAIGANNAGTLIRCRGGAQCAGATIGAASTKAEFSGYAEDCVFGPGSLGGNGDNTNQGKLTGTLRNCVVEGSLAAHSLEGATIDGGKFTMDAASANSDGFVLADGNSVITGATILVNDAGTGVPINAAAAQNVVAVNCTFNNGDNDADGIGANVTNTATTPSNGVY